MAIPPGERAFLERLASLSGWDIAKELGLSYSGDANPIDHGGYFYDPTHWEDWEYAPCVEFIGAADWDGNRLRVERGTIVKPSDLTPCFECIGLDEDFHGNAHAQIDAVKAYWGFDPDDYEPVRTYDPDTWAEWRLWRSILPMLRAIAPQDETDE